MQRLLCSALVFPGLLLAGAASAQTTIDLTTGTGLCTYTTSSAITANTANGHLQATQSGPPVGPGCPTGGSSVPAVTFGPAADLSATSTSLAGGTNIGTTFAFQPLHAASCTGSIQTTAGSGTGSFTGGNTLCNSDVACSTSTPLSIPASFTNTSTTAQSTYAVSVTCNADVGASPLSTASRLVTITQAMAGGGGGSCATISSSSPGIANYTQLTGNVAANYYGAGTKQIDPTQFTPIFDPPGSTKLWPGVRGVGVYFPVPVSRYVSAAFTVPAGYFATQPSNVYGFYTVGEQNNSAPVSLTISTTCGDFSPSNLTGSTVVPGCVYNKAGADQGPYWKVNTTCILQPSKTYYLNLINADISTLLPNGGGSAASTSNANCLAGSCTMSLVNGPGNWTN